PTTGCVRPHPLITSEEARLRVPRAAEGWPQPTRLAGVSSVGPGGPSVHMVLRRGRDGRRRRAPGASGARTPGGASQTGDTTPPASTPAPSTSPASTPPSPPPVPMVAG